MRKSERIKVQKSRRHNHPSLFNLMGHGSPQFRTINNALATASFTLSWVSQEVFNEVAAATVQHFLAKFDGKGRAASQTVG